MAPLRTALTDLDALLDDGVHLLGRVLEHGLQHQRAILLQLQREHIFFT